MNDSQLLRYSRHIFLDEIGIHGQQRLLDSHALVIGAGGLGCPAAIYLASAGVGTISIYDPDIVDITNLQRQIAHDTFTLGMQKVESIKIRLNAINPEVIVNAIPRILAGDELEKMVRRSDVVLDCSDNFKTRYEVNAVCVKNRIPLITGAAIYLEGHLCTFDFRNSATPCYFCLYDTNLNVADMRCSVMGVFSPLTGVIGSMQAAEAIKLLGDFGTTIAGRLQVLDINSMTWESLVFEKNASCEVCSVK
ncbi:HesA/MoeB/ThiF family protein [Glaciimonas immobilis]|uniref:Molybdopterin/thiamine biosynthesis adenylyltransferase n=1 Tax=Glaciimonas immobilis TaxID=728004 RepID=A0A840RQ41_9BURK|nr:HesA/MoeB/ThiF family protein [Glaciimonas immobilis]KAF3997027.1 HesA/MoeB/ThiF family protein [Glaciimonas immobilis]MBB5199865.1 molybdopterin/thiamine biosynthesis adenylyltransferase [Glaciimonas immobilis]